MSTVAYSKPIPVIAAGGGSREVPIVNLQDHLVSAGCILDPDIAMHRLGEDP